MMERWGWSQNDSLRSGLMSDASAAGSWLLGDRMVNRLGFGAMRLAAREAFNRAAVSRDRRGSVAVLRRAVELGVNHIDTAAFYFSSRLSANELINSALAPYPGDLVVATKVGPGRNPDGSWATWSRARPAPRAGGGEPSAAGTAVA